jgi:hypothetical protein
MSMLKLAEDPLEIFTGSVMALVMSIVVPFLSYNAAIITEFYAVSFPLFSTFPYM